MKKGTRVGVWLKIKVRWVEAGWVGLGWTGLTARSAVQMEAIAPHSPARPNVASHMGGRV